MYEDEEETSQQTANTSKCKKDFVKVKWLKKTETSKKGECLSFTEIKEKIGICSICQRLPDSDCLQLPKCMCYFCKKCLFEYLDKFAVTKPFLKESSVSLNPEDYGKGPKEFAEYVKKNKKIFGGVFNVNCLSFDGSVLPIEPQSPKPPIITKPSDFEERHSRKIIKTDLYQLVKLELFDCPNCFAFYDDINRTDLRRFRAVGEILELMNKNEEKKNY